MAWLANVHNTSYPRVIARANFVMTLQDLIEYIHGYATRRRPIAAMNVSCHNPTINEWSQVLFMSITERTYPTW